MESISPNIFTSDISKTIDFYKQLGFSLTMSVPETGPPEWVMMTNGEVTFMFQSYSSLGKELPEINRAPGGSLLFYIRVKQIRKMFDELQEKAKYLTPLAKTFYGATEFSIQDPNGYVLTFAEDEL
jgi:uncharacterized glyoxalase superfamily protein PhnB